jgi:hypothetical protein
MVKRQSRKHDRLLGGESKMKKDKDPDNYKIRKISCCYSCENAESVVDDILCNKKGVYVNGLGFCDHYKKAK